MKRERLDYLYAVTGIFPAVNPKVDKFIKGRLLSAGRPPVPSRLTDKEMIKDGMPWWAHVDYTGVSG